MLGMVRRTVSRSMRQDCSGRGGELVCLKDGWVCGFCLFPVCMILLEWSEVARLTVTGSLRLVARCPAAVLGVFLRPNWDS